MIYKNNVTIVEGNTVVNKGLECKWVKEKTGRNNNLERATVVSLSVPANSHVDVHFFINHNLDIAFF